MIVSPLIFSQFLFTQYQFIRTFFWEGTAIVIDLKSIIKSKSRISKEIFDTPEIKNLEMEYGEYFKKLEM